MGTVQMVCEHCESPLNLIKAKRRYVKKFGLAPTGMRLGLCACGGYVMDKDYYRRIYEHESAIETNANMDRLAKIVSVNG